MKEALLANTRFLLLTVLILSSSVIPALAYYHPDEGRWINRDPIQEKGGANVYNFVFGNPIQLVDKNGRNASSAASSTPTGTSGPDVTAAVNATLTDISATYRRWTFGQKCKACASLYADPNYGWDIIPLKHLGFHEIRAAEWPVTGTGAGLYTVAFNGKVFDASSVNYAMWGRANSLCYETFGGVQQLWSLPVAFGAITVHKLFWGLAQVLEADAFTMYGYTGYLPPVPVVPWVGAPGDITVAPSLVGPAQPLQWRWRPNQNPDAR